MEIEWGWGGVYWSGGPQGPGLVRADAISGACAPPIVYLMNCLILFIC